MLSFLSATLQAATETKLKHFVDVAWIETATFSRRLITTASRRSVNVDKMMRHCNANYGRKKRTVLSDREYFMAVRPGAPTIDCSALIWELFLVALDSVGKYKKYRDRR